MINTASSKKGLVNTLVSKTIMNMALTGDKAIEWLYKGVS